MKSLIILLGLCIAFVIGGYTLLQNGTIRRFLDAHPDPKIVPPIDYAIGAGYYLMQDLPQAATYFIRIPERYPSSEYADDAQFRYLQALDDQMAVSHEELAQGYEKYLQQFPQPKHREVAEHRIDQLRSGR